MDELHLPRLIALVVFAGTYLGLALGLRRAHARLAPSRDGVDIGG